MCRCKINEQDNALRYDLIIVKIQQPIALFWHTLKFNTERLTREISPEIAAAQLKLSVAFGTKVSGNDYTPVTFRAVNYSTRKFTSDHWHWDTSSPTTLVDWLVAGRFPHRTVPRLRYHNEYDDCLFFMEHSVYVGEKSCRGIVLSEESHDKIRLRNGWNANLSHQQLLFPLLPTPGVVNIPRSLMQSHVQFTPTRQDGLVASSSASVVWIGHKKKYRAGQKRLVTIILSNLNRFEFFTGKFHA